MFKPTKDQLESACNIVAKEMPYSDLYHIVIKPLPINPEIDKAMAEQFPTLAAANVVTKSKFQAEREERGQQFGRRWP